VTQIAQDLKNGGLIPAAAAIDLAIIRIPRQYALGAQSP
jgi:hypothetical protein